MFVQNLLKAGYVTVDSNNRTILTDSGKKFLDKQTKDAAIKVELAKLKNLEYRKSLERKNKRTRKNKWWLEVIHIILHMYSVIILSTRSEE